MTDNPTPNDIALLREALKLATDALALYADPTGYTDNEGEQLSADAEMHEGLLAKHTLDRIAALAPGQHDGAAGEGPSEEWLNDPASLEGELPSTEQARAEGVEGLESRIAKLMIGYHVAICSPKGVVPDDEFYDPAMAADIRRMLDAGIPVKSAIPSGADALGGGR